MLRIYCILSFCLFSLNSHSIVSVGGYVPFGLSTQKDEQGGKNTFSFKPMVAINTVMPIPSINHVFLPEFGIVAHGSQTDEYKKSTMFFLLDVGYLLTERLLLRYGMGTFMTKISGDGAVVTLPNGSGTAEFFRPNEGETSWNTTLDLGVEYAVDANNAVRLETYLFSWLKSARKFSYSLSYTYYL
jgi:hypothetical protein